MFWQAGNPCSGGAGNGCGGGGDEDGDKRKKENFRFSDSTDEKKTKQEKELKKKSRLEKGDLCSYAIVSYGNKEKLTDMAFKWGKRSEHIRNNKESSDRHHSEGVILDSYQVFHVPFVCFTIRCNADQLMVSKSILLYSYYSLSE